MEKKKSNIKKTIEKNVAVNKIEKKILYGFHSDIVTKMNEDKPYAEIFHVQFPGENIESQMEEKHPNVNYFEVPIIFKNKFQYDCLEEDYFCGCKDEVMDFIKKTYNIEDDEEDLCDVFDPEMMEPNESFDITSGKPCVDLRNWVYTSEKKPQNKA